MFSNSKEEPGLAWAGLNSCRHALCVALSVLIQGCNLALRILPAAPPKSPEKKEGDLLDLKGDDGLNRTR